MTADESKRRYDPTTKITPETGEAILKAYLTENPRPSHRVLAERFGLSRASVQRYVAKHEQAVSIVSKKVSNEATAQIVVKALPEAEARIKEITKDLATEKMSKVLAEAELQYEALKDENPQMAGAYLREMRQTIESMGRWLGIEKDVQDAKTVKIIGKEPVFDCPVCHGITDVEIIRATKLYPKAMSLLTDAQLAEVHAYEAGLNRHD